MGASIAGGSRGEGRGWRRWRRGVVGASVVGQGWTLGGRSPAMARRRPGSKAGGGMVGGWRGGEVAVGRGGGGGRRRSRWWASKPPLLSSFYKPYRSPHA
jgi:hypothetical protein